ncbi:MAG: bifunctional DNA-binding transcriptional regulator/O6-methylguanine-DNA methyltransferase Ada [Azoarcus sp.]|nr:bifunctional DNA-binding transcriptional regulator/O6-methylguanine-DNA methyltransferase Ada [Azoarcus sp.]
MNARSEPSPRTDDDTRWAAVCTRDATADGRFVYAVRTTGVYCRPSCGARTPRRENVVFHDSPAAAEAAGFRACRRCKPDQPDSPDATRVAAVCRHIDAAETLPPLAELARVASIGPAQLRRAFRAATGLTPKAWGQARRAARLRKALDAGAGITTAVFDAGYESSGRFYAEAHRVLGMTPRQWRDGGHSTTIRFAIGQCWLGAVLVAATSRGLCAVLLGDEPDALVRELQDRFPRAELCGGDADFEQVVAQVVGFVEAPHRGLDLPLDLRGTAFQLRVWQALRDVPAGTTVSYTELARRIGAPAAVRAVAGACAANALAVAIPCHRVVRLNGDPSGYRWGVARKRALIAREGESQAGETATGGAVAGPVTAATSRRRRRS